MEKRRIIRPSEMKGAQAGTTVAEQAQANAEQIYKKVTKHDQTCYACDEMEVMGKYSLPQGEIFIELENQTVNDLQIPFGSPIHISDEAPFVNKIWGAIPQVNRWDNDLPNLIDQQGANATLYQLLGKRLVRHPLIISGMEVITDTDAQRAVNPEVIYAPWNIEDAETIATRFNGVYKEVTMNQVLGKAVVLGEFCGLLYTLFAGESVKINLKVCAMDRSQFELIENAY